MPTGFFPSPGGAIEVPAAGCHLRVLSPQVTTAAEDQPGAYRGLTQAHGVRLSFQGETPAAAGPLPQEEKLTL
jgi:hypothetical protein